MYKKVLRFLFLQIFHLYMFHKYSVFYDILKKKRFFTFLYLKFVWYGQIISTFSTQTKMTVLQNNDITSSLDIYMMMLSILTILCAIDNYMI